MLIDKKISKKERQKRDGKSRGLPHQPGDETKFERKDIETYYIQYSDAGGCMLCDHGSFHAVTCQEHFAGQSSADGPTIG